MPGWGHLLKIFVFERVKEIIFERVIFGRNAF